MFGRLRLRRVVISMLLLRCFYLILSDDEEEHYYLAEATNSSSRDEFFGEKIPKVILQLREKVKAIEKEMEMKNKALAYRYKIKKGRGVKIFDGKDEEEAKQGSIATPNLDQDLFAALASHPLLKQRDVDKGSSNLTYALLGPRILDNLYAIFKDNDIEEVPARNNEYHTLFCWNCGDQVWEHLELLKPHQRINYIPGFDLISNKTLLSTFGHPWIPASFLIPKDYSKAVEYADRFPGKLFIQKGCDHGSVGITKPDYFRYILPRHFIQEWVHPQLLLEGHSLDFGLDVVITSVSPLRAYVRDEAIVRSYLMSYDYLMQGASLLPEPDVKTARVRLLKLLGLEEKPNYSEQEKIVDI